jgi:hypothetical protein
MIAVSIVIWIIIFYLVLALGFTESFWTRLLPYK